MKKLLCAFVISGLVFAGALTQASRKPAAASSAVSINDVLKAHSVGQNTALLSIWRAEAVKLTPYPSSDEDLPGFFERRLEVGVSGDSFKRSRIDPLALREQVELFDGKAAYRSIKENGRPAEQALLSDSQRVPVEFFIKTFGLLPILNQLSGISAEVTYLGRTTLHDKFNAVTAMGNWIVYCDQQHLIRRLEFGNKMIEYADYRLVNGIRLPFVQRLSFRGKLAYELVFTSIELGHDLPASYFHPENI